MKKLLIYEQAIKLVISIRQFIESNRKILTDFEIQNQIRRSSLSVALNIAEGSCLSSKWFQRYLYIAGASANETYAILEVIQRCYQIQTEDLQKEYIYLGKRITVLRKSLSQKKILTPLPFYPSSFSLRH